MILLEGEHPEQVYKWRVEFLNIKKAQKTNKRTRIEVFVNAPIEAVAARLGWIVLEKKIKRVPYKEDFHLLSVVQQ